MIFTVYALAIDKYIEVVWETAVRKYRIMQLMTLIDQSLDRIKRLFISIRQS
ncbi:IDEAL domain-containing protein [Paenibacillus odorifer]|uniref:IDEAL domain-containing protein n=1 Tax=Paenibacillus odorifer TaxID=189426 RepID=UPI0015C2E338|nr:IDEAL domain-containing protein [Paenibacillus odorifer]